jgi:hypothetical protein
VNLDIGGFLLSTEFLSQIAALVVGLFSSFFGVFINGIFGTG